MSAPVTAPAPLKPDLPLDLQFHFTTAEWRRKVSRIDTDGTTRMNQAVTALITDIAVRLWKIAQPRKRVESLGKCSIADI